MSKRLYCVKADLVVYVVAENEKEAQEIAHFHSNEVIEDMGVESYRVEPVIEDHEYHGGWDGNCIPYEGSANNTGTSCRKWIADAKT